jgi:hypothetical protein
MWKVSFSDIWIMWRVCYKRNYSQNPGPAILMYNGIMLCKEIQCSSLQEDCSWFAVTEMHVFYKWSKYLLKIFLGLHIYNFVVVTYVFSAAYKV